MQTYKRKTKFRYSKDGTPNKKLWNDGWVVSHGFNIFGFLFLKYTKFIRANN